MHTDTYIPRRLDDNWKIGFWDVDVAAPVLLAAFLGYLSGTKLTFVLILAVGIALSRWVSRLKAEKHPAFAIHWLWWHLPATPLTALAATPPSHIRRMVG
ncbi:MAG: type IV conjugative transfer system protein TraL [Azoarcus sp.]|jgi:conjugal transfer pilus assembly protein TraL|nr:type IV conjugative transfer system protein TraL [Azoarcus sp.]